MADTRHKNYDWELQQRPDGSVIWPAVTVAVLMDIRDELQTLNRVFSCWNFLHIPQKLDNIQRNTAKKRRKRKP